MYARHVDGPSPGDGVTTESGCLPVRGVAVEIEQGEVGAASTQRCGDGGAEPAGGAGDGDGAPGEFVSGHGRSSDR
ncbi:hypothetical protein ACWF9G_02290 [Nocardia sp. NPDC055029]